MRAMKRCRASPVNGVSWLPSCSRTFLTASDSVTDCRTSVARLLTMPGGSPAGPSSILHSARLAKTGSDMPSSAHVGIPGNFALRNPEISSSGFSPPEASPPDIPSSEPAPISIWPASRSPIMAPVPL
ncbi:hypothetical protein D3C72_1750830 [compost metagenome]